MPLTFPSHQGLILPVARRWPQYFNVLALSVGAAMPDLTDSTLGFPINGYFKQWYGHSLLGVIALDLPYGLFITWLLMIFAARFLKNNLADNKNVVSGWKTKLGLWSFSILVGTLSHLAFDLISHDTNLLLYPWRDNIRWYPEWWYTTWFEIYPVPMPNHLYSAGIFTVVWGILSVIGVFLFFRFLYSKNKTR